MKSRIRAALAALLFAALALSCATAPESSASAAPAAAASPAASAAQAPAPAAAPAPAPAVAAKATAFIPGPAFSTAGLAGAGPAARQAIAAAAALSAKGAWKSAFDGLSAADPANADPWILAARIDVVLEGRTGSFMHQQFDLVDLQPGQDLESLRDSGESPAGSTVDFDPAALVLAQAAAGVVPSASLDRAMARYWYEVSSIYADQWLEDPALVSERALESFSRARAGGLFDAASLAQEAEILLGSERPEEAEALLSQAIALEPAKPDNFANRAIARYFLQRLPEGLADVDTAIALNKDEAKSMNLYALGAKLASDAAQAERSDLYLAAAEKLFPEDPSPGLYRQTLALETGDAARAAKAADDLMDRYPFSPDLLRALLSAWIEAGDPAAARAFSARSLAKLADNAEAAATILYFDSLVILQGGSEAPDLAGLEEALGVIGHAEERFLAVYPPEHEVFASIAQIKEEIGAMITEASAPGEAAAEGEWDATSAATGE